MNELAINLVQLVMSSAAFYWFYKWALSRETFFTFNRYYLMLSLLLSVIFSFFNFNIFNNGQAEGGMAIILQVANVLPDSKADSLAIPANWSIIFMLTYLLVSSILMLLFAIRLVRIYLINRNSLSYSQGKFRIVNVSDSLTAFSFFHYIFIPHALRKGDEYERILQHEQAHARQWHTLDILFIEFFQIVFWFNPMVYLYKKSIKETHEYLADAVVVKHGYDKAEYQLLIFQNAVGAQISVANCFNQSQIKNRIVMLTKKRSDALASIKGLMALPLAMFLFFTFATSSVINAQTDKGKVGDNGAYNIAAVMPVFVGGEEAIKSYIFNNVVYPKAAKEKGITGKVYIKFVVDENGKVVDASVLKSANSMLNAEALRLISGMPAWIPGKDENNNAVKVNLVIPINFALN